MSASWNRKELWRRAGDGFSVEVSRHECTPDDYGKGPHRWAVYAYIYPKHPHFKNFSGDSMFQDASNIMPFHGGPSYLRWHVDAGPEKTITSVQVGADYDHLYDSPFTHMATAEDADEVFADAEALFIWLQERSVKGGMQ